MELKPPRRVLMLALLAALSPAVAPSASALTLPWAKAPEAPPPAPPRPVVTALVIDTAAIERSVPGIIAAETQVDMAFQTLGRMIERPVDVGDRVERGQVLARLDPEDLEGNVRAAEAAVAAADVNLSTAQATAERTRALASRNVATRAQLEQAEQGLASAAASRAQAASQLASARDAASFTQMTAPFAGIISQVHANVGTVVSAGDPVLTLSSEGALEAQIDLTEAQLAHVNPATRYVIDRDGAAGDADTVEGTVSRIDPVADAQTRTRRVHIRLDAPDGLRIGSLIRARRLGGGENGGGTRTLTIPAAALTGSGDDAAVWVVTRPAPDAEDGTVSARKVTAEPAPDNRVTILNGLAEGDEVVIRGVHSLKDGQAVGRRVEP